MENVLTRTTRKHETNAFNLTYLGVNYKLSFYLDGDNDGAWFCSVYDGDNLFDLYAGDDNHNLCAFPTIKMFKKSIEKLAMENELRILPQEDWDEINLAK